METTLDKNRAAIIPEAQMLPLGTFMVLFGGFRFLYKGSLMSVKLINFDGDLSRGIEIGDFLYIEQNKFGNSKMAQRRRAGELILNIVDKRNNRLVGRVVNGKVIRL